MGVGIDQARSEDGFRPVEALAGLEARVDFGFGSDPRDALAADGHRAALDHRPLRVPGDDVAGAPDPIGGFRRERADEQEETTDTKHRRVLGKAL